MFAMRIYASFSQNNYRLLVTFKGKKFGISTGKHLTLNPRLYH